MAFLLALTVGIPGQGVLEPAKLLIRVTAEGLNRFFGKEHPPALYKLSAYVIQIQVFPLFNPQKLTGIWIAAEQQADHLVEGVNNRIGLIIHILLKLCHPYQI